MVCQERLLVACLRPVQRGAADHAGPILKLLVQRLRQARPGGRIVSRADSCFCTLKLLGWCDRNGVDCIVGLAKNKRLNTLSGAILANPAQRFAESGRKARHFTGFRYATRK